jgi:hypothetical protein
MPPPMLAALWIGLLDLHERLANSWNLIGGQALVGEAAALSNAGGPGLGRLRREFVRTPIAIRLPTADRTDSDSVAGARHRAGLVGHPVAGSRGGQRLSDGGSSIGTHRRQYAPGMLVLLVISRTVSINRGDWIVVRGSWVDGVEVVDGRRSSAVALSKSSTTGSKVRHPNGMSHQRRQLRVQRIAAGGPFHHRADRWFRLWRDA